MSAVLGIDGGGTRTRASIVDGERVLAFAENGSIKRLRVGEEVAETNLRALLKDVFTQSGLRGVKAASAGDFSRPPSSMCPSTRGTGCSTRATRATHSTSSPRVMSPSADPPHSATSPPS